MLEPRANGEAWAWATEHGAPGRASVQQLVSWLARGELPPHTLVWKPGWGEWLPAMQVGELAAAFPSVTPGSRRVARLAPELSSAPPPVPVAHYPRLRLLAKDVVGQSPAAASFTGIVSAQAERRAFRDLDAVQQDLVTSQVPVAAMLEAARAMKRPAAPRTAGGRQEALLPSFNDPGPARPRRTLSPLALELGFPALLEPEPVARPPRPSKRYARWVALGAVVGSALGLFAFGASWRSENPATVLALSPPTAHGATPSEDGNEARVVTGACRPSGDAVRIDEWTNREIPPVLAPLEAGVRLSAQGQSAGVRAAAGWVAVAYAQNRERAAAIALSPATLEIERLAVPPAPKPIFSVSPIARDGALAFRAEREGASVAFARTVIDVDPPLRVGMNAQGLVAGRLQEPAQRVWQLPPGAVISVPAIAVHAGGLTLATLVGRGQGTLRAGVMSAGGEPLSELVQLGDSSAHFGRPALASGGGTTALAVAARSADGARQSIWLSRASAGEPPELLRPFDPKLDEPIGGGAEIDTPAIAALPGGGFALAFTQGQGWERRVRLQRFSSALDPIDAPVDVTQPDPALRGASVGALYWVNDGLIAFHFLRGGKASSLWVSSIGCELR